MDTSPMVGKSEARAWGSSVTTLFRSPLHAARLFLRAHRLDTKRETLPLARNLYEEVVRIAPGHAEAWNNLGVVCLKLGDKAAAMNAWGRGLLADPERAELHNNVGSMLQCEEKFEVASVYLLRAVRLDPEMAEARVNLALCLQTLGRLKAARRHWREYLERFPGGEFAKLARKHEGLCAAR